MKVRSEEIGYSPGDMANCPKCGRANPPDRSTCFYCSAAIETERSTDSSPKINTRELEGWENGFNIVILGLAPNADTAIVARLLQREPEMIASAVNFKTALPIARLEAESDAVFLKEYLEGLGLPVKVISDVALKSAQLNVRVRSLEFAGETLTTTDFNTMERVSITAEDIDLIVCGTIYESRFESIEQAKKKGERKSLSSSETTSDERLVDVYVRDRPQGWRVRSKGFDFSGLGDVKSYLATENFEILLDRLRSFAPLARFCDEFSEIRHVITDVWPAEVRTDFEGIKHAGLWKAGFSKQIFSNNLEQFNRYSRLQRLLL